MVIIFTITDDYASVPAGDAVVYTNNSTKNFEEGLTDPWTPSVYDDFRTLGRALATRMEEYSITYTPAVTSGGLFCTVTSNPYEMTHSTRIGNVWDYTNNNTYNYYYNTFESDIPHGVYTLNIHWYGAYGDYGVLGVPILYLGKTPGIDVKFVTSNGLTKMNFAIIITTNLGGLYEY